jgi:hypothetical protein
MILYHMSFPFRSLGALVVTLAIVIDRTTLRTSNGYSPVVVHTLQNRDHQQHMYRNRIPFVGKTYHITAIREMNPLFAEKVKQSRNTAAVLTKSNC